MNKTEILGDKQLNEAKVKVEAAKKLITEEKVVLRREENQEKEKLLERERENFTRILALKCYDGWLKIYDNVGKRANFSYLRNKETEENDLIIEKNMCLYLFEIKKTANPRREMLNNFRFLGQVGRKVGNGGLICLYDKMYELSDGLYVLPLGNVIDLH